MFSILNFKCNSYVFLHPPLGGAIIKVNTVWLNSQTIQCLLKDFYIDVFTTLSLSKLTDTPDKTLFSDGLLVAPSRPALSSNMSRVLGPHYLLAGLVLAF